MTKFKELFETNDLKGLNKMIDKLPEADQYYEDLCYAKDAKKLLQELFNKEDPMKKMLKAVDKLENPGQYVEGTVRGSDVKALIKKHF